MEFYRVCYETYRNGELYYQSRVARMLADKVMENETISVSWENILEVYSDYYLAFPFNLYNTKKGMVIHYYGDGFFGKKVKSWKVADPKLELRIIYNRYTPSIKEVLDWHDGEKASQYLKEKGWKI